VGRHCSLLAQKLKHSTVPAVVTFRLAALPLAEVTVAHPPAEAMDEFKVWSALHEKYRHEEDFSRKGAKAQRRQALPRIYRFSLRLCVRNSFFFQPRQSLVLNSRRDYVRQNFRNAPGEFKGRAQF